MRNYAWLPVCASLGLLLVVVRPTAAAPVPFTFNWASTPAAPLAYKPDGGWDVQIHVRAAADTMEPMDAQHGPDCSAPPATHPIVDLEDGVFVCKNHLMTAINDGGYGEIALTSDHMVDFSSGTSTVGVNVSTQQFNNSDWTELWITPFDENITLPFNCCDPDLQGPPKDAIRFSFNSGGVVGTHSGDVTIFSNYVASRLAKQACTFEGDQSCINPLPTASVIPVSAVNRAAYEIDLSQNHIRFGLPGVIWWTDADTSVPFSSGVVQLVHHTYNAAKHSPGTGNDTWHWSNFSISNSVPFTIVNGSERSIHATGATTAHFSAPAPADAFLRFSAIGPQGTTYQVSYDGGASWVSPSPQQQQGAHDEHFSSYWSPIPAGVQTVIFKGQDWWGGSWWVRDPAIWSRHTSSSTSTSSPPPSATPSSLASPTPSAARAPTPTPTSTTIMSGAGCNNTSTGFQALTDLGSTTFKGQGGGLYPGGANTPPAPYQAAGVQAAHDVVPLNAFGAARSGGQVVFLSIGMSNTTMEFSSFANMEASDPQRNSTVLMVDGAQGAQPASDWTSASGSTWGVVDQRLAAAGATPQQVEVIWLKQADMVQQPIDLQTYANTLQQELSSIVSVAAQRFPNLRQVFVSPRTYGGYSGINVVGGGPNPEPWAYETGFADKWLVAQSVANPNRRPWVGWGPYWWTDGTRGRADGLQWLCSDTGDGTHPSASGLAKTNSLLRSMFVNSVFTPWFTRSVTTPNPSPSPTPSPSPSPSATPGPSGTGLAIVNAPCMILFNGSQLRGSCDGNFVPNPDPTPVSSSWPAGIPVAISAVPCMVLVYGSPQTGVCTGTFRPS